MTSKKHGASFIVPTFRRPDGIKRVLESLAKQKADGIDIEIIVADNDPDAGAREFVARFAKNSKIEIHYLHVPNPGVSNARNAALEKAKGRYLAFIDDDQEPGENWLVEMIKTAQKYNAALVFCPTHAKTLIDTPYEDYFIEFFSRNPQDLKTGVIDDVFGCGNSLLDLAKCKLPNPPFDPAMNETGGEDDVLFAYIKSQNTITAWCAKCYCNEYIPANRTTPDYVKKRSFSFGQSPTQDAASDKNWFGVIKWMLIGLAQYMVHMPLALIAKLFGRPSYIKHLAKAYAGMGKILWFGNLTPKLYGLAALEKIR